MMLASVGLTSNGQARGQRRRTQRLYVVLVPATFDVFHHETRLADLRVAHHADLDDH